MNRAFRPEPQASAELEDAAVWYNGQRPGLGVEFVDAVDAALEQIARWPQIGRTVPGVPKDVPARRFPAALNSGRPDNVQWHAPVGCSAC
jgi:plasmid stabilization system protein ParE